MPQDFAKPMSSRRPKAKPASAGVWFGAGFAAGLFAALLIWLLMTVPPDPDVPDLTMTPADEQPEPAAATSTSLDLDFYEMFPKSEVPVVEEYLPDGKKQVVADVGWLLQVGSFRDPADADALRARLILEGYEVTSRPTPIRGETYHRVMLGPIESEMEVSRIQDKLDDANIASLRVRVEH